MGKLWAAILMLALPIAAFLGGAWIMGEMSGREEVAAQLRRAAAPADRKPLNTRFAYDAGAAERHWEALGDTAPHERRFLELDLVFPFVYGGAFAISLLLGWAALGRAFNPAWVLAPVVIAILADWSENLVHLDQLDRFLGGSTLAEGWIRLASLATAVKLISVGLTLLALLGLTASVLYRAFKPA